VLYLGTTRTRPSRLRRVSSLRRLENALAQPDDGVYPGSICVVDDFANTNWPRLQRWRNGLGRLREISSLVDQANVLCDFSRRCLTRGAPRNRSNRIGASRRGTAQDAAQAGQATHRKTQLRRFEFSELQLGIFVLSTATTAPNWAGANLHRSCLPSLPLSR